MYEYKFVSIVILVIPVLLINGYSIPEVTVQASKNGDLRVYIRDGEGVKEFSVHIKINEKISIQDPGDLFQDVTEKTGAVWLAQFSNAQIKIRDIVHLWVSVTVDSFNYRKEGISVTINELFDNFPALPASCRKSATVYNGGIKGCMGNSIIYDDFDVSQVDGSKWTIEHWIPTYTPPKYIFNSYENRDDNRYIKNGILYLKPTTYKTADELRGILDLKNGCTSTDQNQCYIKSKSWTVLPPIKSAKITSKVSFKYGKVDIRAKLPAGEWIFPVIQLEQKTKQNGESSPKVLIAYSRGNDVLRNANQKDIGARVLYGGPVLYEVELDKNLVSTKTSNPFYNEFHEYTLLWEPGKMTFRVDGADYGTVELQSLADDIDIRGGSAGTPEAPFNTEYRISLGVGVGGLHDFPDGFISNNHEKPWVNTEPKFYTKFFDKKSDWGSTWKGDASALQVDYVKVTAL